MIKSIKKVREYLIDIMYPPRCPICDGILARGAFVCEKCRQILPFITTGRCEKCGKPVEPGERLCEDCMAHQHIFSAGMGLFAYDETMKKTMSALKYKGRKEYGTALGGLLYENTRDRLRIWKPEEIVPVPLHPERLRRRGYNQAEVIASELSGLSGIPLTKDAIIRRAKTHAMKNLNAEERRENLQAAFSPGKVPISKKSVLLIDDIMTTGATLDAAAAVLKEEGARDVWFLAVCIGKGFMLQ